jgi:hypothetical protein
MSAPAVSLEHLGVLYDDLESLVACTGPRVADAVDQGDDVYLAVDRRTARGFRDWLGPASERVEFPSPREWPRDLVRDLRSITRPGRRTLVLGQYTATGGVGEEHVHAEAGINLVLGDLPMTLLCTCAHDADPALVRALHAGHPALLVDGVPMPNPEFRQPASETLVPAALWGPTTLRLDFCAPVGLRRLREQVARAAAAAGLCEERVRDAVQATHEAAVVAAGGPEPTVLGGAGSADDGHDERAVPCVLEVRADVGAVYCEIVGPAADAVADADADALRIVRMFCDQALVHDDTDGRRVRVLRVPDPGTR